MNEIVVNYEGCELHALKGRAWSYKNGKRGWQALDVFTKRLPTADELIGFHKAITKTFDDLWE